MTAEFDPRYWVTVHRPSVTGQFALVVHPSWIEAREFAGQRTDTYTLVAFPDADTLGAWAEGFARAVHRNGFYCALDDRYGCKLN